jgi:hypothetical protein
MDVGGTNVSSVDWNTSSDADRNDVFDDDDGTNHMNLDDNKSR